MVHGTKFIQILVSKIYFVRVSAFSPNQACLVFIQEWMFLRGDIVRPQNLTKTNNRKLVTNGGLRAVKGTMTHYPHHGLYLAKYSGPRSPPRAVVPLMSRGLVRQPYLVAPIPKWRNMLTLITHGASYDPLKGLWMGLPRMSKIWKRTTIQSTGCNPTDGLLVVLWIALHQLYVRIILAYSPIYCT